MNGQGYTVNGMKLWTSDSERADWMFPAGAHRAGAEVDLGVPGGHEDAGGEGGSVPGPRPEYGHLNEVYFDNVHIPASALLGEEHKGWDFIIYGLSPSTSSGSACRATTGAAVNWISRWSS